MKHRTPYASRSATFCGRSVLKAVLSAIVLSLSSHSSTAQQVTGNKGDYKAPLGKKSDSDIGVPRSAVSKSVVPKSIYLTPKSDRLGQPVENKQDQAPANQTTGSKSDRQHVSPSDEEPWIEEPDEGNISNADPQDDTDNVPEITIPFAPNAIKPARVTRPNKRKKQRRKAKARQPIDIAYRNGRLKLNRFHTLKIDMLHHECRDFPNIFLADYKLPRSAIDILSDNMLIVQKRICADNGAVLITCYQNNATISMRRARPDDGCKRK